MKLGQHLFQTILLLILPFLPAKFNSYPLNGNWNFHTDVGSSGYLHESTEKKHSSAKGIKDLEEALCFEELHTIVIDPGHGGHDPGCKGGHSQEKHIALAISKMVADSIRAKYPNLKVILTRETDVFIPLHERASIANRNHADLFISVHCNFFPPSNRVNGSETYVLGTHRMQENLDVAMRENASIFLEDDYEANYDYDPNSPEGHIMLAMFQNAYLDRSIRFAEIVEDRMKTDTHRKSRGVRQAGFLVLRETAMPSVLIEAGYLSNGTEENFLYSLEGQEQVARAIVRAFQTYQTELSGGVPITFDPLPMINPAPLQVASPIEEEKPKIVEPPVVVRESPALPPPAATPAPDPVVEKSVPPQVQFRIQLAASPNPLDVSTPLWKSVPYQIQVLEEGNYYKYQARSFLNLQQAEAARSLLKDMGFRDAFIVAYQGMNRITIQQAVELLKMEIKP